MVMNPGITTVESYQDRQIIAFLDHAGPVVPVLIAPGQADLLAGTVLGKNADGYYAPVRRTTLTADAATGQTELSVNDPTIFSLGQVIHIREADGAEAEDLGAITAIGENSITVTNALSAAISTGAYVYVADGSETAKVILAENVPAQAAAVNAKAYLGGVFYSNMLVGLDAVAKADLGARVIDEFTIIPV